MDRLRSKPNNEKAQQVLVEAYPLALKTAERNIENAMLAREEDRYDILVQQYELINRLASDIYHCPKAYQLIPNPKEYVVELAEAKKLAAERAYNMGVSTMVRGDIERARVAYRYFLKANDYVPGYKDVANKLQEARYEATLRVIVRKPLTGANYQYTADFFFVNLMAEMAKETRNKLVRFYTPDEAQNERMNDPHQIIILDFVDFTVGNIRETTNTKDVSRDSVVVGTVKVDGKTYNSYNTVKAKYTVNRRDVISKGVLGFRILDAATQRVFEQRNFGGEFVWHTEWASFNGDERALTADQKKICGRQPAPPPPHQDLFVEFTKPIFTQTVSYVRSIYSKRY